ncbi:MAG: hypothetical protein ROZ37_17755 [Aromatoleum sp.]|jgi:hypothetical protein|uniref:hypothetical protein n=1 Tax=Aromatoleum sp. TaxID=2307007 RepID=UPI0028961CCB|nr:hypothetical protein [Aromatoleum sp.]MDT3672170.1 hypothetical protein [Aromatoleum sp.]
MGKKKHKKASRKNREYAAENQRGASFFGYGDGAGARRRGSGRGADRLLEDLPRLMKSRQSEQFLLGALVGAAAAYVLSDEELRGKLVKTGIKLYSNVVGSFEEMKEQVADLKAEVEAERMGAE